MKKSFVLLLLSLIASVTYAETTNNEGEKSKTEKETVATKVQEGGVAKTQENANETEKIALKETKTTDPDSSYYSVNKFNYLFYYVYKLKYLSDDDPDLIMGVKP